MIRHVVIACGVAAAAVVACQVYSPEDLVGSAGAASGGTGAGATGGNAGLGGTATSGNGGTLGDGGTSMFDAGAGGEDSSGGTGGTTAGTSGTGGTSGGAGGAGGKGGTGGAGGAGGGSGTGGAGGTGGAMAGTGGGGAGGAGGSGGTAGAGAGGTDTGGAGASGAGTGGTTAGSAGTAGAPAVELTGTPTASSSENTTNQMHPATHGNDNDPATRWCAANGNTGHYWQVDLGAVHPLTRFEVTWEYPSQAIGFFYLYAIGISDDGTTFTTVIDKTTNTDASATQSVDFPAGTMARHVRITITGLPAGATPSWASFWEASVFGY